MDSLSTNEITFRIANPNKVLDNSDDLTINFFPNKLISSSDTYMLTVSLKEQILYSDQLSFSSPSTVTIANANLTSKNKNGGIYQVNLYRMSRYIIAYSQYLRQVGYVKAPTAGYNYYDSYYYKVDNNITIEDKAKDASGATSSSVKYNSTMPDIRQW